MLLIDHDPNSKDIPLNMKKLIPSKPYLEYPMAYYMLKMLDHFTICKVEYLGMVASFDQYRALCDDNGIFEKQY